MNIRIIVIVSFAAALMGCEHNPLSLAGIHDAGRPTATVSGTATQTSAPTSVQTSVSTGIRTDSQTSVQTKPDTITQTTSATVPDTQSATASASQTATVTATATDTAASWFAILSATAEAVDAFGAPAPDVRSFGVRMSGPAAWVSVSILEKQTQALFYSETVKGSPLAESVYISPGNWTKALAPNTAYAWVIMASSFGGPNTGAHGPAAYTGEFTTGSFNPGSVSVSFTTAAHYAGFTDAVPGKKDVWMGTVAVKNGTPHTIGLNGLNLAFKAWTPAVQATPFIEGSVGDYLTNCRVTGWPNTERFGSAFTPSATTTLNLAKTVKSQDGQLFDLACDLTAKQPQRTTKVALEITDQAMPSGGLSPVALGATNGDPPQVYVVMVGKKDLASADPLPLYVRLSDDQNYPRIVTANTRDNTVARLEFFGAFEKVSLTRLSFVDYGNNGGAVESMRIFDGSLTLFCSGAINAAMSLDCANDAGLMTVDGVTPITIKANINQMSSAGERWMSASGDTLSGQLQVIRSATDSSKDGWFRAVGASGRQYRLTYGGEPANSTGFTTGGPQITVRKTQPTVAAISLSKEEKKITNSTMMGQRQVLLRFSVTADNNADVSMKRFSVDSKLKNVGALFYELHYGSQVAYSDVSPGVVGIVFNLANEVVVPAGTTKIFEVSASVYNASAGASISTSLMGDDDKSQNFHWSDNSADVHSLTSADWWNGYQVKGLPTVEQTLSQ